MSEVIATIDGEHIDVSIGVTATIATEVGSTKISTQLVSGNIYIDETTSITPTEVQAALAAVLTPTSFNGQRIINVGQPSQPNDAATKTYVDATENALRATIEQEIAASASDTLDDAKAYADTQDAARLVDAKAYADAGDDATLASAQAFATTAADDALQEAKGYTDDEVADAIAQASSGDATTLQAAKDYADAHDATTLASAHTYTDSAIAAIPPIVAGAGLTRTVNTIDVVAADASIVVTTNAVGVGVISDAQHGARGGGTGQHPLVTGSDAGFMSPSQSAQLAALVATPLPYILLVLQPGNNTPAKTQNSAALTSAIVACGSGTFSKIIAPPGEFYFAETILIDRMITLEGAGEWYYGGTTFFTPANAKVVDIVYQGGPNPASGRGTLIARMRFGTVGAGTFNENTPGIHIRARCTLQNVNITSAHGHGVAVTATSGDGDNANLTRLENVRFDSSKGHGFHFIHADSNACLVTQCDAVANLLDGFHDEELPRREPRRLSLRGEHRAQLQHRYRPERGLDGVRLLRRGRTAPREGELQGLVDRWLPRWRFRRCRQRDLSHARA